MILFQLYENSVSWCWRPVVGFTPKRATQTFRCLFQDNKLDAFLPPQSLISHCNVPSWQRLDDRTERIANQTAGLWDSTAVLSMTTRTLPGAAADAHCAPLGDGDSDRWLSRGAVLQVDASTRSCRNTASILLKQALDARAQLQEGWRA